MPEKIKKHAFKRLKIWMIAMEIAKEVSDILDNFPSSEKFGLSSQVSRSSISIPSNIAEGSSRGDKSFSHYLNISLGSSFELDTQLMLAHYRNYLKQEDYNQISEKIAEFQRMTIGFQKRLIA